VYIFFLRGAQVAFLDGCCASVNHQHWSSSNDAYESFIVRHYCYCLGGFLIWKDRSSRRDLVHFKSLHLMIGWSAQHGDLAFVCLLHCML
jgi:hypothetical protein